VLSELVDERGTAVDRGRACDTIGTSVFGEPALVDAGNRFALVCTAEGDNLTGVTMGF